MQGQKFKIRFANQLFEIAAEFRRTLGPPIVFISGLGCPKETFCGVWHAPAFERFSVLTFDLMGFGSSSRPRDFSYALEDHVALCQGLMEALDLSGIHLVGHSMGGAVGVLLIGKAPERFSSFVNVEGNLISEDCFFSRRVLAYSPEDFVRSGFEKVLSSMAGSIKHRALYEGLRKSDPVAFYRPSLSLVAWSDRGKLLNLFKGLRIRKSYMYGESNKDIPVLKRLGGVERIEIPGSGHFMMLDNPRRFYQVVAERIS